MRLRRAQSRRAACGLGALFIAGWLPLSSSAQARDSITVRVTADARPVSGATVRVGADTPAAGPTPTNTPQADAAAAGSATAVVTDARGEAAVRLPATDVVLSIDVKGFLPAMVRIPAGARQDRIEVELEPLAEFEEDVVVTARSPTRLQDQPLRVEVIDREEIEEKALMTPGSVAMLIGETTGLRVQPTAPSLGAANVRIQGLRGRYSQLLADGLPLYGGQGDSFSLLQVAPLDLGRVEIIKGVASALYGASALGGVINLVSRRPTGPARELLLNQTSLDGSDAALWWAEAPNRRWSYSVLGGAYRQRRRDRDGDGWTDVSGYRRGSVRPRLYYDNGAGTTVLATGGLLVEDRTGGTVEGARAPDGLPFAESIDTRRGDAGVVARWLTASSRVASVRMSYGRQSHDRRFGEVRERGARDTLFGEVSLQSQTGGHTWVVGAAYQRDGYAARDFPAFDYVFHAPALFVQDEIGRGAVRVALSGRLDVHSEYGVLATPRASVLWRPDPGWTVRLSTGGGAFAPTPFLEDTDETGLSRVLPLNGLAAERAWGSSFDVTRRVGGLELNATVFASTVRNPVRLELRGVDRSGFVNADGPTRTWGSEALGRYRRGPFVTTATYAYTRSTEVALDVDRARRAEVALTPRHYAALDVMVESARHGRAGLEVYYVGRQVLDENPYRARTPGMLIVGALVEKRVGRLRLFMNAENLADRRQTRYDPLVRPVRHPGGRWTVDAWAPLDGRVVNGGIRLVY
jgi:iron complex outermembrane receptor protein